MRFRMLRILPNTLFSTSNIFTAAITTGISPMSHNLAIIASTKALSFELASKVKIVTTCALSFTIQGSVATERNLEWKGTILLAIIVASKIYRMVGTRRWSTAWCIIAATSRCQMSGCLSVCNGYGLIGLLLFDDCSVSRYFFTTERLLSTSPQRWRCGLFILNLARCQSRTGGSQGHHCGK